MPVLSIGGYQYTSTFLDDYSSFGVMFYLKKKSDKFAAFKQYKAWAKRQLGTTLKCRWFDHGGEFLSNELKTYMIENGIETQKSMPDSPQQNGWVERFQQTIINGAEAMWHHAGLSNSFWIYAVKAKLHTYNITLIKRAYYKTPTELWSGIKLNISHLRFFWLSSLGAHSQKEETQTRPKESRDDLCWLRTGIQGIPVLGCSPPSHQNFP